MRDGDYKSDTPAANPTAASTFTAGAQTPALKQAADSTLPSPETEVQRYLNLLVPFSDAKEQHKNQQIVKNFIQDVAQAFQNHPKDEKARRQAGNFNKRKKFF